MGDFKSIVVERKINPYHAFLSSFIAGFAELGMINQGSMNIVSRRAADYLFSYLEARDVLPKLKKFDNVYSPECIRYHVDIVNKILNLMGEYELKIRDQGEIVLLITGNLCRICPKGVGGAAIKGSFCPIPNFIEKLVNLMIGVDVLKLQTKGIEREGEHCVANFTLMSEQES